MKTTTLKFKNQGNYCEEKSARYEAVQGNVIIRVYKCSYSNLWKVQFNSLNGYCLDAQTGDFNAYAAYKGITKKELINIIEETDLAYLQEPAKRLDEEMKKAGF